MDRGGTAGCNNDDRTSAGEGRAADGGGDGIRFTTTDALADHEYLRGQDVDTGELLRWPGVPPMFAFCDQGGKGLTIAGQS